MNSGVCINGPTRNKQEDFTVWFSGKDRPTTPESMTHRFVTYNYRFVT